MLFEHWNESAATAAAAGSATSPSWSRRRSSLSAAADDGDADDVPIFTLDRLHWDNNDDQGAIVGAVAANNTVWLATRRRYIVRWHLVNDAKMPIKIPSSERDEVHKLFCDSTASHVLVALESGSIWYLHSSLKKPLQLCKSGLVAEAIAWAYPPRQSQSAFCLIGTQDGSIYELDLMSKEKAFIRLYSLPNGDHACGLQLELLPADPSMPEKWLVMIASPTRLFQMVGGPSMGKLFSMYADNEASFIELPGDLKYSELHFYRDSERAKTVTWLTGAGLYHGNLAFMRSREDNTLVEDYRLISYPREKELGCPLSVCVTQFHFILLYRRKVIALNQKSLEIAFEAALPYSFGDMIEFAEDKMHSSIFMYSSGSVCEIVVEREDRHMWKLFLDEKQFAEALEFASTAEQRAQILSAQGDHLFDQGQYIPAAAIYSRSNRTFEEIALKFINSNSRKALISFLRKRLELCDQNDAAQRTMMCTWLTELYLDSLGSIHDEPDSASYEDVNAEFVHFLEEHRRELDRNTTFELISSHGRVEQLLQYAEMIGDREWVVNYNIQHGQYDAALEALVASTKADTPSSASSAPSVHMYYQFAPVMLEHLPSKTVDALLEVPSLDPSRLLPALMRYEGSAASTSPDDNVALRFLEEVIERRGCQDRTVHNYMISVLVKLGDNGERLLRFIDAHADDVHFDAKYALRLCHQEGLDKVCVRLYVLMGLFAEAVEVALRVDLDLAKHVARQLDEQHPDHKTIWMKLAKHIMQSSESSTFSAVQLLKECPCIQLDDLLPFFPDNVRIADVKEEIVSALDAYHKRIEELKVEMDEYRKGAEQLREEALALRNRSAVVSWSQPCYFCSRPLLEQPFFLFPCEHAFHNQCAYTHVRYLREQQPQRSAHRSFFDSDSDEEGDVLEDESDACELTDVQVASAACVLCSDLAIDSVDKPLCTKTDSSSWDI